MCVSVGDALFRLGNGIRRLKCNSLVSCLEILTSLSSLLPSFALKMKIEIDFRIECHRVKINVKRQTYQSYILPCKRIE